MPRCFHWFSLLLCLHPILAWGLQDSRPRIPAFDFIGKLHGRPVNGYTAVPKRLQCQYYVFEQSQEELEKAAEAELGSPLETDSLEKIFIIRTGDNPIRAMVVSRQPGYRGAGLVLVGPSDEIAPVAERYGWSAKLQEQEDISFPVGPMVPVALPLERSGAEADSSVLLHNFGYSDATVTITDGQVRGYDTLAQLPLTVTVKPLESKTVHLRFPLEAMKGESFGALSLSYTASNLDGETFELSLQEDHHLALKIRGAESGKPELACYVDEDASHRVLEVKNVGISNAAGALFASSGPHTSAPAKGIRLPLTGLPENPGEVEISVDYRRLPNTRWRHCDERLRIDPPVLLDLSGQPPLRSETLPNGYEVRTYLDPYKPGSGSYGEVLTIGRGGQVLATLSARSLIKSWIPNESFWGGARQANQIRYLNNRGSLEGVFPAVVPAPNGVLVQMGMYHLGPSVPWVSTTFFLRWRESNPGKWTVMARAGGGEHPSTPSNRLPNVLGHQYLIAKTSIFQLEGKELRAKLVAKLPWPKERENEWFIRSVAGDSALLESAGYKPQHIELRFKTWKFVFLRQ